MDPSETLPEKRAAPDDVDTLSLDTKRFKDSCVAYMRELLKKCALPDEAQRTVRCNQLLSKTIEIDDDMARKLMESVKNSGVRMRDAALENFQVAQASLITIQLAGKHYLHAQGYPQWLSDRECYLFTAQSSYESLVSGLIQFVPSGFPSFNSISKRAWILARGHIAEPVIQKYTMERLNLYLSGTMVKPNLGAAGKVLDEELSELEPSSTLKLEFKSTGLVEFPGVAPPGNRHIAAGSPDGIIISSQTGSILFLNEFKCISVSPSFMRYPEDNPVEKGRCNSYRKRLCGHIFQTIFNTFCTGAKCGIMTVMHIPPPGSNGDLCTFITYTISREQVEKVRDEIIIPRVQQIAEFLRANPGCTTGKREDVQEKQSELQELLSRDRARYEEVFNQVEGEIINEAMRSMTTIQSDRIVSMMMTDEECMGEWIRVLSNASGATRYLSFQGTDVHAISGYVE